MLPPVFHEGEVEAGSRHDRGKGTVVTEGRTRERAGAMLKLDFEVAMSPPLAAAYAIKYADIKKS